MKNLLKSEERLNNIRRNRALFMLALAVSILFCCLNAQAQSGAGSIQGTVTDSTGAVIPSASIHVVNQATGVATNTKSNSVGFYQVPELFTGTYEVTITVPGMKTFRQIIELLVAQNAVIDASMTPGDVNQQITVSANIVQLVTTDSGSISSTLDNARINELPMGGRNLVGLVNQTTPGLESCPQSTSCPNGQEAAALEYVADGATLTNREFGGVKQGQQQMIDPDAVQQVHVEDVAGSAQFAAPATAIISTKSGTNSFHGSSFWTTRNSAFGVARNRSNPSNYSAPKYIRNEFGASLGGPIVIPHLYSGKNKTFFFFAYERYSVAQNVYQALNVPTQAMRDGDFGGLVNSSNVQQILFNPYTTGTVNTSACPEPTVDGTAAPANAYCRTPYPGNPSVAGSTNNYIGTATEAPLVKVLNAMTPLPGNSNNPLIASNLSATIPEPIIEPQISWRLDQVFNDNNRAYLRYTQNLTNPYVYPHNSIGNEPYRPSATLANVTVIPENASGVNSVPTNVYAASLGYTHVFSPTFFSETVLSQSWYGEHNQAGGSPTTDFESELGLPNNFGEPGFPEIMNIFSPFNGTQWLYSATWTTYNVDENLTKTLGKHQLLFGGRYRFERLGIIPDMIPDTIQFSNYATALLNPSTGTSGSSGVYTNSGQVNADEFLGAAYQYQVDLQPPYQRIHDMEFDAYLQDNWHVRRNLTVDLGLRYEAHPAPLQADGTMMGFDLKNDAVVLASPISQLIAKGFTTQAIITNDENQGVKFETQSQAGLPSKLIRDYNLNFGPRLGVAWVPFSNPGTVFRGGAGRYIYPNPTRDGAYEIDRNNPFVGSYVENFNSSQYTPVNSYMLLSAPNTSPSFSYNTTNPTTRNGWPIMGTNTANAINSSSTTAIAPGLNLWSLDTDLAPTYVDEANFTIEQPLKWGSALRVSYVYTHGQNLVNLFMYNDHTSGYGWEVQEGATTPTSSAFGPYNVNTGTNPYDNTAYGAGNFRVTKTGWSNYNALQTVFQKLFHNGSAWQIMYVWEKNMRTGGDYAGSWGDMVAPQVNFLDSYVGSWVGAGANTVKVAPANAVSSAPTPPNLPPALPAGVPAWGYYKALNRWENYMVDVFTPPHHVQWNALLDLPFGQGKRWLSGVNKGWNEFLGGWQLAGSGGFTITDFAISTNPPNYGPTAAPGAAGNSIHVYKHKAPITDCRTGTCLKSYEWWNGYIAPTAISGNKCAGSLATVVSGLPGNWAPYQSPMDTSCSAPVNGKAVVDTYYGLNDVAMSGVSGQKDGTVIPYGIYPTYRFNGSTAGQAIMSNLFSHTVINGPMNWNANASLFKNFPITERVSARLNVDAFNLFNNQGLPTPNASDGTVCVSPGGVSCTSANGARQIQLTLRINY